MKREISNILFGFGMEFRRTIWLDVDFSFMMMVFLSLLLFKSLTKYSV
jgi:hypothetical protein